MERKRKKKKNNENASSDEKNSAPRPQRQRRNHPAGQGHFVFEDAQREKECQRTGFQRIGYPT